MRRPWSPGPWNGYRQWIVHSIYLYDKDGKECSEQEARANCILAQKAPDMAELLIDYVRIGKARIDIDIAMEELNEVYLRARQLLKEVGYDV